MKTKLSIVMIGLLTFFLVISANAGLYENEQLIEAAGAQSLVYFKKGDAKKPLLIFIPGDSHLARIAYGYPQGQAKDFLAYWLNLRGYSFLALSYPTDNPIFSKTYPGFTIKQWGDQVAEIAKKIINENQLNNQIVVLAWSMGGSIEQSITIAAKKQNLNLLAFIGLAAVPPLPYIMQSGPYSTGDMLKNGLADRKSLQAVFVDLLNKQSQYNQHEIIDPVMYKQEFLGNIPAGLSAEGYIFQDNKLVKNIPQTLKDSGVFDFANTPWIALIEDTSTDTAKISLIDPFSWDFMRAEMIYKNYLKSIDYSKLTRVNWQKIKELINELPKSLKIQVNGNHFFFVGEKGAQASANAIAVLINRVTQTKKTLCELMTRKITENGECVM